MDIIATITDLLTKNNTTQSELMDYLGIHRNVFTDWKGGRNHSYSKYLPQIAEFFGVSVDYLLGTTQKEKPLVNAEGLAALEKRLISVFRGLNREGQEKILIYAEDLADSGKYKKDTASRVG